MDTLGDTLRGQSLKLREDFMLKVWQRKRPVPHISLAGPFETRDIERVIRDVESVAKKYNLVNFKLKGFGYFNKPNGNVIYADIEPSTELEELRWELAKRLMKYTELKEWDKKKSCSFHVTIAFKDIDRKFSDIWRYLNSKEVPNINQYLLRITILRNSKILYEYDLMFKRLLTRRAALSKRIWRETILRFKIKRFVSKILTRIKRIWGVVVMIHTSIPISLVCACAILRCGISTSTIKWYAALTFSSNTSSVLPWLNTPGTSFSRPTYHLSSIQYSNVKCFNMVYFTLFSSIIFRILIIFIVYIVKNKEYLHVSSTESGDRIRTR